MKAPDYVMCPLVDQEVKSVDCIENADAVDGIIQKENVPDRFKKKPGWEEICKKCKWHEY